MVVPRRTARLRQIVATHWQSLEVGHNCRWRQSDRMTVDVPLAVTRQLIVEARRRWPTLSVYPDVSGKDDGDRAAGLPLSGLGPNDDFDVHAQFGQESDQPLLGIPLEVTPQEGGHLGLIDPQ